MTATRARPDDLFAAAPEAVFGGEDPGVVDGRAVAGSFFRTFTSGPRLARTSAKLGVELARIATGRSDVEPASGDCIVIPVHRMCSVRMLGSIVHRHVRSLSCHTLWSVHAITSAATARATASGTRWDAVQRLTSRVSPLSRSWRSSCSIIAMSSTIGTSSTRRSRTISKTSRAGRLTTASARNDFTACPARGDRARGVERRRHLGGGSSRPASRG